MGGWWHEQGHPSIIAHPWHWSQSLILVGFDRYSAPLILVCATALLKRPKSAPAPTQPESCQVKSHKPPLLALRLDLSTSATYSPYPKYWLRYGQVSTTTTLNYPYHYSAILNISLHQTGSLPPSRPWPYRCKETGWQNSRQNPKPSD
jgi:hypothetical protein